MSKDFGNTLSNLKEQSPMKSFDNNALNKTFLF